MPIQVIENQIINRYLSEYFDIRSDAFHCYDALSQAAFVLAAESAKFLPRQNVMVEGISGKQPMVFVQDTIILLPVMRAGLPLLPPFLQHYRSNLVLFLSTKRHANNDVMITCSSEIAFRPNQICFLLDSFIGTGGTICNAVNYLKGHGVLEECIFAASLMASPTGLDAIQKMHPKVTVISSHVKDYLTMEIQEYPRQNDVGRRIFGV